MAEAQGAENAYTCQTCRKTVVTINRAEGTTPFMLSCQVTAGCSGRMTSHFYKLPQDAPEPSIEWYRPATRRAIRRLSDWERDHVQRGGLLYRKIAV